jgi:DNA-binding winged helix-turn-helix (wHTH) protein/tetratricopeptide (TPR) repeat protein
MWAFEQFRLDSVNQCVWRGASRIALKPKPYAVLHYLVAHAGRLVTQDELVRAVWPDTRVQPEVLRQYILEVRRVLGDRAEAPRYIRTVPKRGYEFVAPVIDDAPNLTDDGQGAQPLVGRAAVLSDLNSALTAAFNGRRQVMFVIGEPGIGKTSLMDTFQRHAVRVPGVCVARGHAVEGFGGKEAYYPIFDALGHLTRGAVGTLVVNTLERHAPTWVIQCPALIRTDRRVALQHEVLGATRERMVREFCEALDVITANVGVVLILEDLHWADLSTLDVISAIARRREPARLLVLVTFRPADVLMANSPLKVLKQDLVVHRLASEMVLERLHESDVAEYLAATFGDSDLPAGLAALIHRHSDGNPLFMTAMLDYLVQQRVLMRDGPWSLAVPLEEVDPGIPETLRHMLEVRLHSITDAQRRLLACASVAGRHFNAWSVAAMLARETSEVEAECAVIAESQQFLKCHGMRALSNGRMTLEFVFSHALYREVLYQGLRPAERVTFHQRLAEALEGLRPPADPELAGELALHCEEGGDCERAISYLVAAAQHAARRYAHREAIESLEHARELVSRIDIKRGQELDVHLLERIAASNIALGDMVRSVESYDAMAASAAEAGLPIDEANALMRLAFPAAFVDVDRCIPACERAARLAVVANDAELQTRATLLVACWRLLIEGWRTEDARSFATSLTNLRCFRSDLSPYERHMISRVQGLQSQYAEAYETAERALPSAAALWERALALWAKAFALFYMGRLGEATQVLSTGVDLATKNENALLAGTFRQNLALVHWQAHDFEPIRDLLNQVTALAHSHPHVEMWRRRTLIFKGFAELADGQFDDALHCFEEARHQAADCKVLRWYWQMIAQLGLAETLLAIGDIAKANAHAEALVGAVSACNDAFVRALAWDVRARIALGSGQRADARQAILRALEIVETVDVPLAAWQVHCTAWDLHRTRDLKQAETHRAKAEAIIWQIARSLEGFESSRRFLANERVRRVLEPQSTVWFEDQTHPPTAGPPTESYTFEGAGRMDSC